MQKRRRIWRGDVVFQAVSNVKLSDFFNTWRLQAGLAGNNPAAIFDDDQLLGHQTTGSHLGKVFVNGDPNADYERYVLQQGDPLCWCPPMVDAIIEDVDDWLRWSLAAPVGSYLTWTGRAKITNGGRRWPDRDLLNRLANIVGSGLAAMRRAPMRWTRREIEAVVDWPAWQVLPNVCSSDFWVVQSAVQSFPN
jgi:hypothetical protein